MPEINTTQLIELVNQGKDNKEIAAVLNIHPSSVSRLLKNKGIDRNKIFNRNRSKPDYFSSKNKVEVNPKDSEFFEIYHETSIDEILFN